jgi:hypothetical protein
MDHNDHISNYQQAMHKFQRAVMKNLWYLEQEGLTVDRGDGVLRWKTQQELDECIKILGGDPSEINQLCTQALEEV